MKKVINHLILFGYEIHKEDNYCIAQRDSSCPIIFNKSKYTTNFCSYFRANINGNADYIGFLKFINDLNNSSCVTTFYAKDEKNLEFDAYYMGDYDQTLFTEFIRAWEFDTGYLLDQKNETPYFLLSNKKSTFDIESYCDMSDIKAES